MNKILLIIKREYLSRVRKKSFVIMTIVAPILMTGLMVAPILLHESGNDTAKEILVCDENELFETHFEDRKDIHYQFIDEPIEKAKEVFAETEAYALVHIPKVEANNLDLLESIVKVYARKQVSLSSQNNIEYNIEKVLESIKLKEEGLTREIIDKTRSSVSLNTIILDESGDEKISSTEISMGISMASGFLIYIFIFIYGTMVMKGVMEEKSSRIVEIIISSVKPFQLMMGKIIGIALVGFTQFALWIVLTVIISSVATGLLVNPADINPADIVPGAEMLAQDMQVQQGGFEFVMEQLGSLNLPLILGMFLFYFVGGYLMYGSLFAAVGAAVDVETDTQQFMMPITIPLIFGIIALQTIVDNPDGPLAFWCSIIPFTSPIVMMGRIPFDPPMWQIGLSMIMLILGFIFTAWLAGRIYRVGILMYGQKVNYKTMWKWIRHH